MHHTFCRLITLLICAAGIQPLQAQTDADTLPLRPIHAAMQQKAEAAMDAENYHQAEMLYTQLIEAKVRPIRFTLARAEARLGQRDLSGARKDYQTILKQIPTHYAALVGMGRIYGMNEEFEKAISYFDQAIALDSLTIQGLDYRAFSYHELKQYEPAIRDYTRCVQRDTVNTYFLLVRAQCYDFNQQPGLAQLDLEHVLRMDSTNRIALINLGFSHLEQGHYAEAEVFYKRLQREEPGDAHLLSNYGYLKHKLGQTAEGLEMIRRSLIVKPNNSYAYKYRALIYLDQGKTDEACEAIQTALKMGYTEEYGSEVLALKAAHCN